MNIQPIFFSTGAFTALLLLSGCSKQIEADPRLQAPLVKVTEVSRNGLSQRAFTGTVKARVETDLGFRVSGKVVERLVDTGATVKAGQPLMRMDRTDYIHAITNQQGVVAAAVARHINAQSNLERCTTLLPTKAISKKDYDDASAEAASAKSLLDAAQAQLQIAKDNDSYTELVADSDGVVIETIVEPGQVVAAGQIVVKLAHAGPREAVVNLPEMIRPVLGSKAKAALYGNDSIIVDALLRQLSDAADPTTRTYEARYILDGKAASAPLGATVTIYISNDGAADTVQVPLAAIYDNGKGPGVWVLKTESSQVTFQSVQIAQLGAEDVILSQGPAVGTRIVAMGANFLHEGARVRVADGDKLRMAQNDGTTQ